jgi:hypothetical protein
MFKLIGWIVVILFVIGIINSKSDNQTAKSNLTDRSTTVQRTKTTKQDPSYTGSEEAKKKTNLNLSSNKDGTIEAMISDYKSNEARFHENHKGKQLRGSATVSEIRADVFGTGSIFFIDLNVNGSKVKCSTDNKQAAASLNKGDVIQFIGLIDDIAFGILNITNCDFSIK